MGLSGAFLELGGDVPDLERLDDDKWEVWLVDPYESPEWRREASMWRATARVIPPTMVIRFNEGDARELSMPLPPHLAGEKLTADDTDGYDERDRLWDLWHEAIHQAVDPLFLELLKARRAAVEEEWRRSGQTPPVELSTLVRYRAGMALVQDERNREVPKEEALIRLCLAGKIDVLDACRMGSTSECLTVALAFGSPEALRRLEWTEERAWDRLDDRQRQIVRWAWDQRFGSP